MSIPDNDLYRMSYDASLSVLKMVVPFLKDGDETRIKLERSARGIPNIIAVNLGSGRAKEKDLCELGSASRMCRESIVMLSYCRDLHGRFINGALCNDLIDTYSFVGARLEQIIVELVPNGEALT